ncbi:hypothetical protein D9M68_883190 [compost metagenome]
MRGRAASRFDHQKPSRGQGNGRDLFADALDPGVVTAEEKGDVCTQLKTDGGQLVSLQTQAPEPVERQQRARRVR